MQTAIHPPAPRAIKNQNKSDIGSITLTPVYRALDKLLNYSIKLILIHGLNPALCNGTGRISFGKMESSCEYSKLELPNGSYEFDSTLCSATFY